MNTRTFDYVIVGAGSAGCVLANRLSVNPNHRVCLIEAGPEDKSFLTRVPVGVLGLMWDPRHNWKYYTEPEPFMNNRRMYCPRGKVLGGSSSVNAMVFTRGVPDDFDRWVELGSDGWGWDDMLPHFKATQKQLRQGMDPEFHGYDGEQLVVDATSQNELSHDFLDAVVESGVAQRTDDLNAADQEGVTLYQVYQNGKGQRCSSAHAFLHPVRHRSNLTVMTGVFVEKIVFDGNEATGVQCKVNGVDSVINADKEVVLSAGAINSPHLLMLSGIGDQAELEQHNVPLVHHLPGVGKNLSDHIDIVVNTEVRGYKGIGLSIPFLIRSIPELFKYIFKRQGILTANGAEAGGFVKSDLSLKNPDIQMLFSPAMLEGHFMRRLGHGHCIHLYNVQPKSRGFVKLKSNKPNEPLAIQFNYCEHPDDMAVMVKCVKIARRILAAPSLFKSEKRMVLPSAEVQSDEEIEEFVRNHAETNYHPVGTCKMGVDELAVVDPSLRVHGLKRLRVVDASVMPAINSGNTHSNVIAIANKAAEMILND
ncbi:MAG: GMC family oxidoreductase N-terminal domain-containing protein [Pseudomonadota bacterium]